MQNAYSPLFQYLSPIYANKYNFIIGSYARGDALPESDIDLRIDGGRIRSMFGLGGLYNDLKEALKKPVDLVTTEALNHHVNAERTESFKKHIKEDEKLIYEAESV